MLAVRCRPAPAAGLGRFLPWPVGAGEDSHRDLAQQLSAWRVAYPDVRLETLVADEPAAALLVSLAGHARLAVVGRPARGALLELLAASPARTLVRRVPCPVAVVPPRGMVRSSMLPSRPEPSGGPASLIPAEARAAVRLAPASRDLPGTG